MGVGVAPGVGRRTALGTAARLSPAVAAIGVVALPGTGDAEGTVGGRPGLRSIPPAAAMGAVTSGIADAEGTVGGRPGLRSIPPAAAMGAVTSGIADAEGTVGGRPAGRTLSIKVASAPPRVGASIKVACGDVGTRMGAAPARGWTVARALRIASADWKRCAGSLAIDMRMISLSTTGSPGWSSSGGLGFSLTWAAIML